MQISVPNSVLIVNKPVSEDKLELLKDFIKNALVSENENDESFESLLHYCLKGDCEVYLLSNDFLESSLEKYKDLGIKVRNVKLKQDCSKLGLKSENYKDLQKALSGDSEAALKFCKDFNKTHELNADNPKVELL